MSEVEEDVGSDVSDLEKDNNNKGNINLEDLQKQRLHLEEQLKQQVQRMTPAKELNKANVNKNMLSVPTKKNKKGKDIESASDLSSAEESEELNTDDSADATNEEESENDVNLESVTRERRQSNLVRINTQTKWSEDQMDALKGELLDQISQMATQNTQRDTNFNAYSNYHTNHYHPQHTNGQLNNNLEQLNGTTSTQAKVEVNVHNIASQCNFFKCHLNSSKKGDSKRVFSRERDNT
ncbi:hypothetical protein RFI_02380 [Reticulomyxa filosa]|uniref:Uncharacterized protein n=1 Tax=Reticulomyxa filosa TaxID=46433 RepID=X6P845_RETFI|nr:hypothetical protein RFI_02380 [Reticulomyxa filosa]|eukprot:ETO34710.1 hypothetical protein RFI_02380 [Reticulomyxa filosa]